MMRDQTGERLSINDEDIHSAVSQQSSQLKYYDVVIVGAGIGGLTAAVEATRVGKKVLIVERRSKELTAIRPQLIFISYIAANYLNKLSDESDHNQFITEMKNKTKKGSDHFSIKHIQRFLMQYINNDFCDFHYEAQVSEINFAEDYLVVASAYDLSKNEKIKFGDLILADGIKHGTANLLQEQFEYSQDYVAQRDEKKHVMGYFILDAKLPYKIGEFPMQHPLGVVLHDDRVGFIYYDDFSLKKHEYKKVKLCIVMNLDDAQYKVINADDQLGNRFLRHCVENVFSPAGWDIRMTKSKKSGQEKDKLKYATFQLELFGAKQAAVEVNGHIVALVGDARRGPDFYQGHGGNDAIIDGQNAGRLINRTMSLLNYNVDCAIRSESVSSQTKITTPIASSPFITLGAYSDVATFPELAKQVDVLLRQRVNQFQLFYHAMTTNDRALETERSQANEVKSVTPQRRTFQSE